MADGYDIADVAEDDAGQLQLIIFHIGNAVEAQHVAVNGSADDDQDIGDTAGNHEFSILIYYQQARHRQDICECDRGFGSAYDESIEDTVADDQIVTVQFHRPALDPQQDLAGDNRQPG